MIFNFTLDQLLFALGLSGIVAIFLGISYMCKRRKETVTPQEYFLWSMAIWATSLVCASLCPKQQIIPWLL